MPRKTQFAGRDPATIGGRFEFLLKTHWSGHQARMAADLGVTQALISKVARGEQEPGPKLINALAAVPGLNRAWLIEGTGPPFAESAPQSADQAATLPVCRVILPGPPSEVVLSGMNFPVAAPFRRPTRYFYEVAANDPIVVADGEKVAPRDLLLVETDSDVIAGVGDMQTVGLCAARFRVGGQALLALARFTRDGKTDGISIFPFLVDTTPGAATSISTKPAASRDAAVPKAQATRVILPAIVSFRARTEGRGSSAGSPSRPRKEGSIEVEAIVGLVVQLVRPWSPGGHDAVPR